MESRVAIVGRLIVANVTLLVAVIWQRITLTLSVTGSGL